MAKVSEELELIKGPWARSNKFTCDITLRGSGWSLLGVDKSIIENSFPNESISITLPDLVDTPLEEYLAENWFIARGRRENFLISVQLRAPQDMSSYNYYLSAFKKFERTYPKDQYCSLAARVRDPLKNIVSIVEFNEALLIGVSGIRLDHSSENGLIEYSLTFKTGNIRVY